ncbi:MAG: site-specific integrase [Deltaproteobacteria bacterium]|nr:site-specific integrase [Deltaproteobacteria bacterium]
MKGGVYENKSGRGAKWFVKYGKIFKRFDNYEAAETFLTVLRGRDLEKDLDERDYQADKPLGFSHQADKWLKIRKGQVRCFRNLKLHMRYAEDFFEQTNVKHITYGDIEDFVCSLPETHSNKTKANVLTTLHAFFVWLSKREGIKIPEFPVVKYELGYRQVIDLETQTRIIDEVKRISCKLNPKIWFGIRLLATYIELRPGDLIKLKEKHIVLGQGILTVPHPKDNRYKVVPLMEEDVVLIEAFPKGFPELHFFRHNENVRGTKPGQPFGKDYFYRWWREACKNLGIEGVPLYPGTRHSTTTALANLLTPEEIRIMSNHTTNRAFERYFQRGTSQIRELRKKAFGGSPKVHSEKTVSK